VVDFIFSKKQAFKEMEKADPATGRRL